MVWHDEYAEVHTESFRHAPGVFLNTDTRGPAAQQQGGIIGKECGRFPQSGMVFTIAHINDPLFHPVCQQFRESHRHRERRRYLLPYRISKNVSLYDRNYGFGNNNIRRLGR